MAESTEGVMGRKRDLYKLTFASEDVIAHIVMDDVLVEATGEREQPEIQLYHSIGADRSMDYQRQPAKPNQYAAAFQPIKELDGVPLAYGVVAIAGSGGSGKTPLARTIADSLDAEYILFGEPNAWYEQRIEIVAYRVMMAYLRGRHVVIDSIKDLFFTGKGATGTGGINKTLFKHLSQWGAMFQSSNLHLVVTANVLTQDERVFREATEGLTSATNQSIFFEKGIWNFRLRDFVKDERVVGTFRYDDKTKSIVSGDRGSGTQDSYTRVEFHNITAAGDPDSEWAMKMARALERSRNNNRDN